MTKASSSANDVVHAPHPPLHRYYDREEDRRDWVRGIFDKTAQDYALIERVAGLSTGARYRRRALERAGLRSGMRVLDVGVGTGLVASAAAELLGKPEDVIGIDPSLGMLDSAEVPSGVRLIGGRAERMPVADASFDFLSMGYVLRHIGDLSVAFREFHRVLKPGGRLCLLEVTRPKKKLHSALLKGYLRGVVPMLARILGRQADSALLWRYYWDTIEACVPPERVLQTLEAAGFSNVHRYVELGIFSEYRGSK